jgi:hypothetical protein
LTTTDTVVVDTCASRATSAMVGLVARYVRFGLVTVSSVSLGGELVTIADPGVDDTVT